MSRFAWLSLLVSLSAAACTGEGSSGPVIPIGAVLDNSGNLATPSWTLSARLAVSDANAGLAQAGKSFRFQLVSADSTNTPKLAVSRAQNLIQTYGARAIVADSSQDDIALNTTFYDADSSNDLNVPIVCIACTSPAINNPAASNSQDLVNQATLRNQLGWNFRTVMDTFPQSRVLLSQWLAKGNNGDVNGDGMFKMTIYASDEAFGHGFASVLASAANLLHPSPPPIINTYYHPAALDPNVYDWSSDLAKLLSSYSQGSQQSDFVSDLIIEATFPQFVAALVKTYAVDQANVPLLHTHAARLPATLNSSGWALDGQEGTSHVLLDNGASGEVFAQELIAATSVAPIFLDAHSYDAAMVLLLASVVASRDLPDPTQVTGAQIRDAMHKINEPLGTVVQTGPAEFARAVTLIAAGQPINYEGASGPLDFDANNNVRDRLVHWRVENEQFVDLEKYDCVSSLQCPLIQ